MRTSSTSIHSSKIPVLVTTGVALLLAAFGHCAIAQQHVFDSVQSRTSPIYGGYNHKTLSGNSIDNSNATGGHTFVNTTVSSTNELIEANNHALTIKSHTNTRLYGGSSILIVHSGKARAGDATSTGDNGYTYTYANAQASAIGAEIRANGNTVTLSENATAKNPVYGGSAILGVQSATASAGHAFSPEVSTSANAHAYADTSVTGSSVQANNNTVAATHNTAVTGHIYGGKAELYAQSDNATAGDAIGGTANSFAHAHAVIANSSTQANHNVIRLENNASVSGAVYGGHSTIRLQSADAQAGNAIAIDSAASSATADVHTNARGSSAVANNNVIHISDNAKITGNIYGGYSELSAIPGTATGGTINGTPDHAYAFINVSDTRLSASENQITLDNTLKNGSIYGGYAKFNLVPGTAQQSDGKPADMHVNLAGSFVRATDNTVTIGDYGRISDPAISIYGGYLDANPAWMPANYDVFSGNTMSFSARPVVMDTLANFEHYHFTIQPTLANTTTSLITAQHIVLGTDTSNSNGAENTSKVSVVGIHSGPVLHIGDKFYLMQAENSMTGFGGSGSITQAQQGISLLYNVQTDVESPRE